MWFKPFGKRFQLSLARLVKSSGISENCLFVSGHLIFILRKLSLNLEDIREAGMEHFLKMMMMMPMITPWNSIVHKACQISDLKGALCREYMLHLLKSKPQALPNFIFLHLQKWNSEGGQFLKDDLCFNVAAKYLLLAPPKRSQRGNREKAKAIGKFQKTKRIFRNLV